MVLGDFISISFGSTPRLHTTTGTATVSGRKPVQQIKDILICSFQVAGLANGQKYYCAVTVVDKSGNE